MAEPPAKRQKHATRRSARLQPRNAGGDTASGATGSSAPDVPPPGAWDKAARHRRREVEDLQRAMAASLAESQNIAAAGPAGSAAGQAFELLGTPEEDEEGQESSSWLRIALSYPAGIHPGEEVYVRPDQHGQSAVFGGAELTKPASSHGSVWLPPALHSLEEPRSHSACPGRLRVRRQAVPKSLILLRLALRCPTCSGSPRGLSRAS